MATRWPSASNLVTAAALPSGLTSAIALSVGMPSCWAIAFAVSWRSPVSIHTCKPIASIWRITSGASGLRRSRRDISPINCESSATKMGVLPASAKYCDRSNISSEIWIWRSANHKPLPTRIVSPVERIASTPQPITICEDWVGNSSIFSSCALAIVAAPRIWFAPTSALAASCNSLKADLGRSRSPRLLKLVWSSILRPNTIKSSVTTSVTSGCPVVKVPVLSKITADSWSIFSRLAPPLIKIPLSAPMPVPTMIAVGVAKPNAQGQATTKTAIAKRKLNRISSWITPYQIKNVEAAIAMTE